jgi:hypothetical protein
LAEIQQHIIRKSTIAVSSFTPDGFRLQRKISNLVKNEALNRIGDLFDELVSPEEWLIIDRLDVHLDDIKEDELESRFTGLIVEKIKALVESKRDQIKTGAVKDASPAVIMPKTEKTLNAFLFFLEKGVIPWWYEVSDHFTFEVEIEATLKQIYALNLSRPAEFYFKEFKRILAYENAAFRLAAQFETEVFDSVLGFMNRSSDTDAEKRSLTATLKRIADIAAAVEGSNDAYAFMTGIRSLLIQRIAGSEGNEKIKDKWLSDVLRFPEEKSFPLIKDEVLNDPEFKKFVPPQAGDDIRQAGVNSKTGLSGRKIEINEASGNTAGLKGDIDSIDGVIVKNAGLVIVTPFLPELFKECGILDGNKINDIDLALAILHFVVWGNLEYREYDTALSKVICNIESTDNMRLLNELEADIYSKADEMLKAVVRNWGALKDTSPDGLRESFLQRRGKLNFSYDNWFLYVEQNTIDVLLQSLPWTIGFIKLPWMKTILKTEWI